MAVTEAPTDAGVVLLYLDPRDLLAASTNVREDLGDLTALTESVRELGVLQPVIVTSPGLTVDGYRLVAGQRRCAAAVGADLALVPALYREDLADLPQWQAAQLVENEHRKQLTTSERVAGYAQLELAGMKAADIAKATGAKVPEVRRMLAVAKSDVAAACTKRYDLTLEQGHAIADFGDNDEAVKVLVAAARQGPGSFAHMLERLRQDRARDRKRARLVADLTKAGYTIIQDSPPSFAARISMLAEVTEESHAGCPGRAVILTTFGQPIHYCLDWQGNGHEHQFGKAGETPRAQTEHPHRPGDGPMTEAQKAERRAVIEGNKAWEAATVVRHRHIKTMLAKPTVPEGGHRFLAEMVLCMPGFLGQQSDETAGLLGLTVTHDEYQRAAAHRFGTNPSGFVVWEQAKQSPTGWVNAALVGVCGAFEHTMGKHTWRDKHEREAAYFLWLHETGYTLADIEKTVVTEAGLTVPEEASDADA